MRNIAEIAKCSTSDRKEKWEKEYWKKTSRKNCCILSKESTEKGGQHTKLRYDSCPVVIEKLGLKPVKRVPTSDRKEKWEKKYCKAKDVEEELTIKGKAENN
jgi:hypothetical protein